MFSRAQRRWLMVALVAILAVAAAAGGAALGGIVAIFWTPMAWYWMMLFGAGVMAPAVLVWAVIERVWER